MSFISRDRVLPLSVIAGEIATGKTSVLEFIAYCLGSKTHPQHQEIQAQVRSAQLELAIREGTIVIERAAFSERNVAWVHRSGLADLDQPHEKVRKVIDPSGAEDSLSTFLLEQCGLAGISLKEAPTKADSATDPLSFRDLLWLCLLENERLDSGQLLFEGMFMKNLKLRQVIEVLFGVHDDQLAQLGDQLRTLESNRERRAARLDAQRALLDEQGLEDPLVIEAGRAELASLRLSAETELGEIDDQMRAATSFADAQRVRYTDRRHAASQLSEHVRYNETLLQRLLPLRAQYAEDERKLTFYSEAKTLFDPLRVELCPSCLQALPSTPTIADGRCSLCGQDVAHGEEAIDVSAELAAIKARRRELGRYIEDIESRLDEATSGYENALQAEGEAQRTLDDLVAQQLAPFVAQRDELFRTISSLSAEDNRLERQLSWHVALERRQLELVRLDERIAKLKDEIQARRGTQNSRDELRERLTERFHVILSDFHYPKLTDPTPPQIQPDFSPVVRSVSYRETSSGARTLIALAWQLAIFELAIQEGAPHPGFLMIDSPQKNLTPEGGERNDDLTDPEIGSHVWDRLIASANGLAGQGQLIVADNRPRPQAEAAIVKRFTGDPTNPPYGLIDNELPA